MTNEKQKINLEGSNVLFFLICQSENVSVLEKVSKPALSSFVLMIFFFTHQFYFLFVFGNGKERRRAGGSGTESSVMKTPPPPSPQWKSPPSCHSEVRNSTSHGHGKWTGLVGESLTGFFPATGCAPHVSLLHAIYLSALLRLTTGFPW